MLEVENIYELKLSHKIEEHGLLIFKINSNTSARLHISNLSNNHVLNKKMFELFDIGHKVTVLVTGFNEEKNYFELSTKAFRNSLDDVLSFTKCKNLIEEQFQKRSSQDTMFLMENRRILDRLRGDLASTGLTFLYELLQNAIDHPNNNFNKELSIHFEIFGNYLLLKHNGALFTENNFKSLCGILYGEQQNETGSNRIGYKGIGFKSVFRHTNNAYIRSGNFSFCFNRDTIGTTKPWEVMPIFQNEIDKIDEIPQFDFFNSPVAFAFEFPSNEQKDQVIQYLTELAQNPYLVIFLDKLKKLKITTPNNEHVFEKQFVKDDIDRNLIRLIINGSVSSEWMSFSETFLIEDPKIINELTNENIKSIPEHFRQFRNPQVDLIIPLDKIENPINIFAYLPLSATRYQLDYILNGDFIPNLDRSNIIDNLTYNLKLVEFAGFQVVKACESFAVSSEFSKLKQIFPSFETGVNPMKDKLQVSFLESVKDSEIFPSYYDGKLSCFANTVVDHTELYLILPKNQYNDLTCTTGNPLNPASDLQREYLFLCEKYENGTVFKKEDLLFCLKTESFQNWLIKPENCFSIITHLDSISELQELLKTENVFLNSKNVLVSSNSLYYAAPDEISFIGINVLSSELLELIKDKELSFKLLDFEPTEFFKNHILGKEQIVNSLLTTEHNLIAFWKFVYSYWEILEKETTVIHSLKSIHILCKSNVENTINYKPISSTYLSLEFNNESSIESVINIIGITDVKFISEKYINYNFKVETWRKIFKKVDSITDLKSVMGVLIPKLSSIIDEKKHFEIGKQIFKYWKDNKDKETKLSPDQISVVSNNIKIKCNDGSFIKASDCIIADHYTTNPIIDSFLPEIKLNNQISDDYDKRNSNILEWNNFFKLIGCQILSEKQNVFDAKIKHLLQNQVLFRESHFEILQSISQLHKEKKDNNFSFDTLSNLFLKANTNEWCLPNHIHFSSVYKPKLDLQVDEPIKDSYKFLCYEYKSNEIDKQFLSALGVNSSFRFYNKELKRNEIPPSYREAFERKQPRILQNANQGWANQHRILNHLELKYKELLLTPRYNEIFWNDVEKPNSVFLKYLFQESEYRYHFGPVYLENYFIIYLKGSNCFPNQENELKTPIELFSYSLSDYINDKKYLPKYDLSKIYSENNQSKSLEDILGFQNTLSQEHCIDLLSRLENRITIELLEELQIVKILSCYIPSDYEKKKLHLLNKKLEWIPINELFFSFDDQFEIEPSQQLHENFMPIAKNFGIQELSEKNFTLIIVPASPACADEVKTFFENYAKYIAFKIDEAKYQEIESDIVKKITQYEFYEVSEITKAYPGTNPIFKKSIDFYIDAMDNKIFYKDYWKANKEVIEFLLKQVLQEKIRNNWLDCVLNRWSKMEIIEDLKVNSYGDLPDDLISDPESKELQNDIWSDISDEDAEFIKKIIKYDFDSEGKLDANTTAKIKTLMEIKDEYHTEEISDEGRYLKAGADDIIVRSAQRGLLYLDLYHWDRLKEDNARLSVYTKSNVKIFDSQEDLIRFAEPQNRFGILRMPENYSIDDYNSLGNIDNKGKWHFVFIVNENTNDAKDYKSLFEDPNLFDDYKNLG